MKVKAATITAKWHEWEAENCTNIQYDLSKTYSAPHSLMDILNLSAEPENALHKMAEEPLKYGPFTGPVGMRDEIAKFYTQSVIGNILPTHGAVSANDIVLRYLREDGDNCVFILPTYNQLVAVATYENYEVRNVYLDGDNGYFLNIDELRKAVDNNTKVIVLTNPNHPLGKVFNKQQLEEIVEIARSVDAYILCDEVFRYNDYGKPIVSIFGLYEKGIAVGNFSKFLGMPGIRVGWIVASEDLIAEFTKLSQFHGRICAILDQKILHMALKSYNILKIKQLSLASENLEILDKWVKETKGVSYIKPDAGTTALIQYEFDMPCADLCKKILRDSGVKLMPGSLFGIEKSFVVGFMCDTECLTSGLQLIDIAINSIN